MWWYRIELEATLAFSQHVPDQGQIIELDGCFFCTFALRLRSFWWAQAAFPSVFLFQDPKLFRVVKKDWLRRMTIVHFQFFNKKARRHDTCMKQIEVIWVQVSMRYDIQSSPFWLVCFISWFVRKPPFSGTRVSGVRVMQTLGKAALGVVGCSNEMWSVDSLSTRMI